MTAPAAVLPAPRSGYHRMNASDRFDAAFFRRYYANPATRVATREDQARLAALIGGVAHYCGFRVKRLLDAGCGVGWLRTPLRRQFKGVEYVGLEVSEYLCRKHGWVQGSLPGYTDTKGFDLVVCHDVLQYLPDREAARAITSLAHYEARRSGHALNNALLRALLDQPAAWEMVSFEDERQAPRGFAQAAPAW